MTATQLHTKYSDLPLQPHRRNAGPGVPVSGALMHRTVGDTVSPIAAIHSQNPKHFELERGGKIHRLR
ncbi:hypothetical protein [Planctomicrobium sp. SH527]|uniref:hypothetical protein n=1 Tax=Planctomicrobium sp. SH527 TaxID=3448123 RepID=UPI003F5C8F43